MKKIFLTLFIMFSVASLPLFAAKVFTLNIEPLKDLSEEAEVMKETNQPMFIIFSSPYCIYCETIINTHVPKFKKDPRFSGKVLFRKVDFDNPHSMMVDEEGEFVSVKEFSDRYGVDYFPVVIFINSEGKEISAKIEGYDNDLAVEKRLVDGLLNSINKLSEGKS